MDEGKETNRVALGLPEPIQCNSDIQGSKMLGKRGRSGRGSGVEVGDSPDFHLYRSTLCDSLLRLANRGNASMGRNLGLRRNISQDTDLAVNTGTQVLGTWAVAG